MMHIRQPLAVLGFSFAAGLLGCAYFTTPQMQYAAILSIGLILLGILVRAAAFGAVPGGLNQDEAFAGYETTVPGKKKGGWKRTLLIVVIVLVLILIALFLIPAPESLQ